MKQIKAKKIVFKAILVLTLVAFVFTSCDNDDDGPAPGPTQNIAELAQATPQLSTLVDALTAAELVGTFTGTDEFTVFAPNDAAFAQLGTTLDELLLPENKDQLADILKYHVVAGKVLSGDLSNGNVSTLLADKNLMINVDNGVTVNGVSVLTADIEATNGVVHIINQVLLPPTTIAEELTIAGQNTGDDGLSILLGILTSPGYEDLLAAASDANSTLTVFAPTNAAFTALLNTLGLTLDQLTPEIVRNIIEYHILPVTALSSDLAAQTYATLLQDESITVGLDPIKIDDASVVSADVETGNGVIHIIDQVLLPSEPKAVAGTIVGIPYFNKDFTTLVAALRKAELIETLLGDGPFTVFGPTNAAFEAAGITDLSTLTKEDLTPILLYHVLGNTVKEADLADGIAVTTLNMSDIYISLNDNGAFINGATEITATDLEGSNGVVHAIDLTLTPPANDIVQIAIDAGFSKLAEALTEAGLVATLQGDGPFTVFAPNDAAFDALYSSLGVDGPAEIDDTLLEDVLLYHVLGSRVFSSDLSDGLAATTLSDATSPSTITINLGDMVTITDNDTNSTDANVSSTNILGTNGVIHVIDAVLLPVTL